ncbi:hypothetical protein EXIGLDRAFT_833702 [Exidia glandulosa HHB12029]|uniref:Uncharacterized protein n=1 Tax=Exidia glandulosa HHB12029 TaxID=1314781 RepID=A0A165KHB5_EXIGL|nr:hypothetical protein EXIGLDRAFT_833702 [Exidia glandulosa HHB12029]
MQVMAVAVMARAQGAHALNPSVDEMTRARKRIAELERVIRELKNKPHPRWATQSSSDTPASFHTRSKHACAPCTKMRQFQRTVHDDDDPKVAVQSLCQFVYDFAVNACGVREDYCDNLLDNSSPTPTALNAYRVHDRLQLDLPLSAKLVETRSSLLIFQTSSPSAQPLLPLQIQRLDGSVVPLRLEQTNCSHQL